MFHLPSSYAPVDSQSTWEISLELRGADSSATFDAALVPLQGLFWAGNLTKALGPRAPRDSQPVEVVPQFVQFLS